MFKLCANYIHLAVAKIKKPVYQSFVTVAHSDPHALLKFFLLLVIFDHEVSPLFLFFLLFLINIFFFILNSWFVFLYSVLSGKYFPEFRIKHLILSNLDIFVKK